MSACILVAADAPMIVAILGHKLRREGHDVITARAAADVRRVLSGEEVECAVCEPALLEEAGKQRVSPSCAWLAIVDGRDEGAALRAMRSGAAGIVRTPFKPTEVAAQVEALLAIAEVGV